MQIDYPAGKGPSQDPKMPLSEKLLKESSRKIRKTTSHLQSEMENMEELLEVICGNPCCICSCKADDGQPLYACPRCYLKCGAEHIDAFDGAMHPLCFIQWAPRTCPQCRTKVQFQNEFEVITEAILAASATADVQPAFRTPEEVAEDIAVAIARSLQEDEAEPPGRGPAAEVAGVHAKITGVRRCKKCAGGPLLLGHSCPSRKRKARNTLAASAPFIEYNHLN